MSNGFKRFIETSGKSLDEIREKINKMALDLAVDIVDDATQLMPKEIRAKAKQVVRSIGGDNSGQGYKAEKIPPREKSGNERGSGFMVTKVFPKSGAADGGFPGGDIGAFESLEDQLNGAFDENGKLNYGLLPENRTKAEKTVPDMTPCDELPVVIEYPHEAIIGEQSEQDEFMAEKIAQMRKLEEVSHNGYIVKRCVEITMVRQGEFMKDVTDDYLHSAFCGISRPIYAALSRSQLRTYFTWRTGWRQGLHSAADKPYILLYCYEVLNKIGFNSSSAAYRELLLIWNELCGDALYLNDFLPRWIKDFYAFNRIEDPLPVFPEEYEKAEVCSEILSGNYKNKLDYLADNSSYNIRCSVFVNAKIKPLLDGACEAALKALDAHFGKYGVELSGLICGKMKKDFAWEPFGGAPVDLDRMDGFEPLRINELERYCKKRGEPVLEIFEFAPSRDFIGYVLKCAEARLRKRMAFSHKLSPNISMIKNELANRGKLQSAVSDKAFETLISDAVDDYCRRNNVGASRRSKNTEEEIPPQKVEIDVSKLGEIRRQADHNTELLIVPEEILSEDDIHRVSGKVAEDEFAAAIKDASNAAELPDSITNGSLGILKEDKFVITTPENADRLGAEHNTALDGLPAEWREFAMELIPTHILALRHIGNGTLSEFCREHGLFAQTLFEEINSLALDAVGDVIIEGGEFVEDYKEYIGLLLDKMKVEEK